MMDNGQPDQKRPRIAPPGPWNNQQSRELPPPPSAAQYQHGPQFSRPQEPQQPHPLDDLRRRPSAHTEHSPYDPDPRRPNSGPSHVYHSGTQPPPPPPPFAGPRDAMIKRDPSDESSPLQYRPASTGSAPEHNVAPTHPDERRYLPPYQPEPHSSGPHPFRPSYPPPPQSPIPGTESYGHPAYATAGLPHPRQDPYPGVSYPSAVVSTAKRKAQRAAQACDSCRTLKAKCDEGRPYCTSCKEKGIQCVYRDPPPKQQDKVAVDLMDGVTDLKGSVSGLVEVVGNLSGAVTTEMRAISSRIERMEKVVFLHFPEAKATLKEEQEDTKSIGAYPPTLESSEAPIHPSIESAYTPVVDVQRQPEIPEPENDDDEEVGEPVNPGQSSIPVNHTTGAARLLLVQPIADLARGIIKSDRIKNEKYPMLQEENRGLLRTHGRGEGTERLPGYDKDPLTDHGSGHEGTTPSDTSSDVSSPPGEEWGQLGGLTPPGEPVAKGSIDVEGMPDLTRGTVSELVASYKKHINIMHPILIPRRLDQLVEYFLKSIAETQPKPKQVSQLVTSHHTSASGHTSVSAGFVQANRNPESPGNKRKRSPGTVDSYDVPSSFSDYKPGHPYRSIGTAIVLLVMALGKICQVKTKIPDCVHDQSNENMWSSPTIRNGHPPSPLHSSPAMSTLSGLPSPVDADRNQPRSRRTSIDGINSKGMPGYKPRNLDVIPGLAYFALATDIIGNQSGGNSLQHVHANILASLYHGQLGRPLESHSFLHQACRSLQVILRPKLDRFKRLKLGTAVVPAKDNPLVFAFWTCLQLESDIVAELPVPHSGILTYEEDMPSPNLQAAADADGFDRIVLESYSAQLYLRKHLNQLHNMFYKPVNDTEFPSIFNAKNPHHFPTIDASLKSLEHIHVFAPHMKWNEDDEPARDILGARLRAKYYGAKVITYRHFLLKILEHSYAKSAKESGNLEEHFSEKFKSGIDVPGINADATRMEDIDPKVYEYASNCIKALIKSTTAFYGLGDPGKDRLIVTNIWGTAHAQWGNLLTLQAAFADPLLGKLVERKTLKSLFDRTMAFLKLVAHPSSAIQIDYRILEFTGRKIGLLQDSISGSSFSSTTSGDVPMTGH